MTEQQGGYAAEPGLDLHDWESTWASIEEEVGGDPAAGLSQLADLIRRMLGEQGYGMDDPVARQGDEPEVVVTYLSAQETAERAEVGAASRGEMEMAIDDLRAIFESLSTGSHRSG